MQIEHRKLASSHLNNEIPFNVYGHWGFPVLMLAPCNANEFVFEEEGMIDSVEHLLNDGLMKIFTFPSLDSESLKSKVYSNNVKIHNYSLYLRFIKEEVIPMLQRECNVHRIGICGIGIGAFHATNITFKNPDFIRFLISISGTFDLKSQFKSDLSISLEEFNPVTYLQHHDSWIYNHLEMVFSTSDWDICRRDNKEFSELLHSKGIKHWLDEVKGVPRGWNLWNQVFPMYIHNLISLTTEPKVS